METISASGIMPGCVFCFTSLIHFCRVSAPVVKPFTGLPVSSSPIYTFPPWVLAKAESVSMAASPKPLLNSVCSFSFMAAGIYFSKIAKG
jgi:hypothetical protein